jgi:hypothetical protein
MSTDSLVISVEAGMACGMMIIHLAGAHCFPITNSHVPSTLNANFFHIRFPKYPLVPDSSALPCGSDMGD